VQSPPAAARPVLVGAPLDLEDVVAVAVADAPVALAPAGAHAIAKARLAVEALLVPGAPVTYGLNTGFGALAEVRIAPGELAALQRNLVRSHAAGVGPPLSRAAARAMTLLRVQVLALGYSGVRREVVDTLIALLNGGAHPIVPARGSVGASGDLAPLAHLALVIIGEGEAVVAGERCAGRDALARLGLVPLELAPKEGLALINGTQGMLAVGTLALVTAELLARTADVTGAMSLEALRGSHRPFDEAVLAARPHPGALEAGEHLRALLAGSAIVASHQPCGEVQDAYSLRCMPQVHGATRDLLRYARGVLRIELNAATDNPLVLPDGRLQSGGNFHGQPVAAALDAATMAVVDLASIAERRIAQLVDPHLNRGLPAFLATRSGLCSGFMMAQVTAASLVSEAKALSHPKSVDTIPTSADREDHVSMGMTSARAFAEVVGLAAHVIAIEALVAAQGVELRGMAPGRGVGRAVARLRRDVPALDTDRVLHPDILAATRLVEGGELLAASSAPASG